MKKGCVFYGCFLFVIGNTLAQTSPHSDYLGAGHTTGISVTTSGTGLLGEGVTVKDEVFLYETIICPNKSVGDSNHEKGKIILWLKYILKIKLYNYFLII